MVPGIQRTVKVVVAVIEVAVVVVVAVIVDVEVRRRKSLASLWAIVSLATVSTSGASALLRALTGVGAKMSDSSLNGSLTVRDLFLRPHAV